MLSRSQHTRRQRIIDAAVALASEGGYDAVQMREVAAAAGVALGTVYRYFPSKDHLLVSAMLDKVNELGERLGVRPPRGECAADRVVDVLGRATRGMLGQGALTTAMLRALLSSDEAVSDVVAEVRSAMSAIITAAMDHGAPTPRELAVARVLEYVWMGSLVSWLNGVQPGSGVVADLEAATRMLLE